MLRHSGFHMARLSNIRLATILKNIKHWPIVQILFDKVHFIYSKLFNQSVTFDYESKLIQYIAADELDCLSLTIIEFFVRRILKQIRVLNFLDGMLYQLLSLKLSPKGCKFLYMACLHRRSFRPQMLPRRNMTFC